MNFVTKFSIYSKRFAKRRQKFKFQALDTAETIRPEDWKPMVEEAYIAEAGWFFKTLAVQEIGEH